MNLPLKSMLSKLAIISFFAVSDTVAKGITILTRWSKISTATRVSSDSCFTNSATAFLVRKWGSPLIMLPELSIMRTISFEIIDDKAKLHHKNTMPNVIADRYIYFFIASTPLIRNLTIETPPLYLIPVEDKKPTLHINIVNCFQPPKGCILKNNFKGLCRIYSIRRTTQFQNREYISQKTQDNCHDHSLNECGRSNF